MKKVLRVFEAFSGIGSQKMALRNLGINHEVIGTSEIDIDAIISYAHIHSNLEVIDCNIEYEEMIKFLKKRNIGYDSKINRSKIDNLSAERLEILYKSCLASKNFGDISRINPNSIPQHDLFTYSFPCQDISTLGEQLSCAKNSGTRSSLLWESKKIIEAKKPKYLLLENVRNLVSKRHKKNFELWEQWLSIQGYVNYWGVLDSKDYGIPQRRPRVFMISILGEEIFDFNELTKKTKAYNINDFLEKDLEYDEFYDINNIRDEMKSVKIKDFTIEDGEIKFWDDRDWRINGIMIQDVCSTQRAGRSGLKCVKREGEILKVRKLTPKECWRLMGFKDQDYEKVVSAGVSKTQILRQCGNSIVVNVLEELFFSLFYRYIQIEKG